MDQSQEFGKKVTAFITDMRARSTEPHQKMMLEVGASGRGSDVGWGGGKLSVGGSNCRYSLRFMYNSGYKKNSASFIFLYKLPCTTYHVNEL